jgi:hypothetical protein
MLGNDSVLVVIEGSGSYGAGLAERIGDAGLLVAEPAAMPAGQRRGVGKTDALDAVRIARSVLGVDSSRLRWPRATGPRVVLRVLVVAREQMVAERTRAINALTALLRTIDLGIDTRQPLSRSQIKVIARWRPRVEESVSRAFSRSDPVGQAHRRPQWRAGRQPQGTRCRRRRNRSGTVRAARRRLGGRRVRLDGMVAPRPGAIRSGIRRTSRNLPNTRRPQETPCEFAATGSMLHRRQHRDPSIPRRQRQPQPRDELTHIVEPHRSPVEATIGEKGEPVLQIVRIRLDRVG